MGRLIRRLLPLLLVLGLLSAALPARALGFTGFGPMSAEATYGVTMTFRVELEGGAPDRLELLLRFTGDEGTLVAPVSASGSTAEYVWDAADRHVTPNTRIGYSWRAIDGGTVTVSREQSLLYDDDRPGLDWQTQRIGEATVHWYGGAGEIARRFGDLSADGAAAAEALLGHEMSGPVEIFVYDAQEDFFGALGPGAREWTGAATYPAIRTIFMWLRGGPSDYLETTIVHEVTHVVFNDATHNPFHEPAKWLNEGFASWAERQNADDERAAVEFEASGGGGLFAFEAIAEQFPIGERGSRLAYAQGATMVDMIIAAHGRDAMAAISAAYRDGASDAEALEAGTGTEAAELYAEFYSEFGVDPPQPIEPAPILPSNVRKPGGSGGSVDPEATPQPGPDGATSDGEATGFPWLLPIAAAVVIAVAAGLAWTVRRARRGQAGPA